MSDRRIEIDAVVVDKTAAGMKRVNATVGAAAKQTGEQTSKMISDTTAKKMRTFNERSERMRQVMNMTGSSVGKAAGQVTYLSGTISYLMSSLTPWQMALTAVGVALGFLAKLIVETSDETKAWETELKNVKDRAKETKDAIDELREARIKETMGLDNYGAVVFKINQRIEGLKIQQAALVTEIDNVAKGTRHINDIGERREKLLKQLNTSGRELALAERELTRAIEEQEQAYEHFVTMKAAQRDAEDKEQAKKDAKAAAKDAELAKKKREAELKALVDEGAALAMEEQRQDEEKERRWDMRVQRAVARRKRMLDAEFKAQDASDRALAKAKEQHIKDTIGLVEDGMSMAVQIGGMLDLFGESSAKTEEERQKAAAKRIMVENLLLGATSVAKAASSYPDIVGMVTHGMAATLHFAAAAKAGAEAGGGGSGGGGAAGGGGRSSGSSFGENRFEAADEYTKEEKTPIVINVYGHQVLGRDSGKFFYDEVERYKRQKWPGRAKERI